MHAGHSPVELQRVLALLRLYGHNTTSFQILEPGLRYWFDGDDACVAYAPSGRSWVVAGGPIAPEHRELEVIRNFMAHAQDCQRRVRFCGIEHDLSGVPELRAQHLGQQPFWDPREWEHALKRRKSLREQLRRARAKGVSVRLVSVEELADEGGKTRASVDQLVRHWVAEKPMAPMGFIVHLDLYHLPEERRFFVAEQSGRVVGVLVAVPIYARAGWFFEDVLRLPGAPNGTIELLFDNAMRLLASEGSEHVTFGLAPLSGTPSRALKFIRQSSRWLYDFEGLRVFKEKLTPKSWHAVYLAYPASESGFTALIDLLRAFAYGSFIRFGWRTLLHRAPLVVRIMAVLLLPWTVLLWAGRGFAWNPSMTVQVGWAAFNIALFSALLTLAGNWRSGWAKILAALTLLHFAAQGAQWLFFSAPTGVYGWAGAAVSLAASLSASVFLWCARNRGLETRR